MSALLRDRQLTRLCDALDAVPAGAPSCCEGWTAHDLAVHLWQLHHDPIGWALLLPPLEAAANRRIARLRDAGNYRDLVAQLRHERGPVPCMMPFDALEGHRHALGEYFVHTQDIVRANGLEQDPVDDALAEALWRRAAQAAWQLRWGWVLEHPDGRRTRTLGPVRGIVRGEPAELICWVHGRPAEVTSVPGPPS